MSANPEGIQINVGGLREAIAASLNQAPVPLAVLQQQAPVAAPEPAVTAPPPEAPAGSLEPGAQPQTDLPIQAEDDFELDLSKNPLNEEPAADPAAPALEAPMTRREAEVEFQQLLKTNPRFQRIYENHTQLSKLAAPPEEGGIGFRPDADQVREWHQAHATMDQMIRDFSTGTPDAMKNFVDFWVGKDASGATMRGADQFAENFPVLLAQSNPEAYQKIGTHYGTNVVSTLTQMAQSAGYSDDDKARLVDAANILAKVTGAPLQAQPQAAPAAKPNDEVAALRQRIAELEGRGQQQAQESVRSTVIRNFDTALERDADAALKPLKAAYANQPIIFDALRKQMVGEMREIAMSNLAIRNEINNHINAMTARGDTSQMDRVIRLWRQGYADSLPAVRQNYLKAAGATVMQSADQARAVMQQASTKTAPGPGTAPGQSTSFQSIAVNPGESSADATRRILAERFQALRG
ncbi:MAG: hypothetical protein EBR82_07275 [Caulobacteraceae bacterium]|nr:hypothetical protein [Caulobacteraceae bacterium]